MKEKFKWNIALAVFGILMLLLGVVVTLALSNYHSKFSAPIYNDKTTCSGLNLTATAFCLNNQVSFFYKYNISNLYENLSLDRLEKEGGVCWHYSKWYYDNIKKISNFSAEEVDMTLDKDYSHRVTIMSDQTGYCILDQTVFHCVELKAVDK